MRQLRLRIRPQQTRNPNGRRKAVTEIRKRLSYNVIMYRFRLGLTQQGLADRCRWSESYIARIELGLVNLSLDNLEKLAVRLECTECDLCTKRDIDEINRVNRFKYRKRAAKWLA